MTSLVGRYALEREVARGGDAIVYEARDLARGLRVALKIAADASSPTAAPRLEREGRIAASLAHPNVVAVLDIARHDGRPFIVLEWLEGETLAELLARRGTLTVPEAITIAEQLLDALAAAHAHTVVHRDVKPSNIFLVRGRSDDAPIVKLVDFGAAWSAITAAAEPETLTRTGKVVGTPQYMSPEQVRGLRDFDGRSDLYACGVVLYEMLSGKHPFDGLPIPAMIDAIAFKKAPSLSTRMAGLPRGLVRSVDVALATDRHRRHADAVAFRRALRAQSFRATPEAWDVTTSKAGDADTTGSIEVSFDVEPESR